MEGNASVYHHVYYPDIYPVSPVTGEGRAGSLMARGEGLKRKGGEGGGSNIFRSQTCIVYLGAYCMYAWC